MSTDTAVTTRNISEARLRANRLNALKSTGPKTPQGKDRSRRNGLKHGLSGAGVVLPDDMRAEVDRLIAAYSREFRPANESERQLVEDRALGRVRVKHAWSAETIYLAQEAERATSDTIWRSDRQADAAELGARLGRRPGVVVARLEGTLHGVRWLRERWLHLDVALDNAGCWDEDQVRLALQLLGTPEEFVEKDPAGLGRWPLEELKELTRRQIEGLDELEGEGDLQEADEADRDRALRGFGRIGTPTYHRFWRYTTAACRMERQAAEAMARVERRRSQVAEPSDDDEDRLWEEDAPGDPDRDEQIWEVKARLEGGPKVEVPRAPVAPPPKPEAARPQAPAAVRDPAPIVAAPPVPTPPKSPDARKREEVRRNAKRKAERRARRRGRG
jgi:hypothetical protein